jgi:Thrombospondin type 3 repeat
MKHIWGLAGLCLLSFAANAELHSRAGGQAYYDDVLDITWVADANLARTSGYDTDGRMAHAVAASWIFTLNAGSYLGFNDWRLPTMLDTDGPDMDALGNDGCAGIAYTGTDCGYNVQTESGGTVYSEMAHLYYVTLGNPGRYDVNGLETGCWDNVAGFPDYCLANAGPFVNLSGNSYWTETRYAPAVGFWWTFGFGAGIQYYSSEASPYYGWAVRAGDIGDVPFPDADGDGVADAIDPDDDNDTVLDTADNCTLLSNPTQCDSDGDGYGNRCDGDLNDNDFTNSQDTTLFRQQLGQPSVGPTYNEADLNCNGVVNSQDTTLFRQLLGSPPGPSGLHP